MEEAILVETTEAGTFQVRVTTATSTFLVDEPVEAGGLGSGPNPYDLLGAALGACTAMTIRLYAQRKQWPLEHVRVRITHSRAGLNGRDRFVREIEMTGQLAAEQFDRIAAVSKHCPVHKTIEGGADIETVIIPPRAEAPLVSHCLHANDCSEAAAAV